MSHHVDWNYQEVFQVVYIIRCILTHVPHLVVTPSETYSYSRTIMAQLPLDSYAGIY